MAVSRALRRLLRVLNMEEDQHRMALESATLVLRQLERLQAATTGQARSGRQLIVSSAHSGELPDRLAGLEEAHSAERRSTALAPRIADAASEVDARRQEFLAKRVECRQAETLISEAEARDSIIATRRTQRGLDDWYLNRLQSGRSAAESSVPTHSEQPGNPLDRCTDENLSDGLPKSASKS